MAAPIHCDAEGCEELFDVMMTRADTGDTSAWCGPHFLDLCRAIVAGADAPEIEAADAEAVGRLEGLGSPGDPTGSPGSSAADAPPPEPPTSGGDGPGSAERPPEATPTRDGRQRPSDAPTEAPAEAVRP